MQANRYPEEIRVLAPKNPVFNSRNNLIGIIVLLIVALAGVFVVGTVASKSATKHDSGVMACQKMADSAKSGDTANDSNTPMTADQFAKAKEPWEKSGFADLRMAGVQVVTTIYAIDQASSTSEDDEDLADVMGQMVALQTRWAALQQACGAHGVQIPDIN